MKWLALVAILSSFFPSGTRAEEIKYGDFGKVEILRGEGEPRRLVLLFEESAASPLAKRLPAGPGQVLAVIGPHYRQGLSRRAKRKCVYPAGDLELLSKYLQTKLKFPTYQPPVLVGAKGAASLVYGALAQAPKNTFAGAISAGFCPRWKSDKSFCAGYGVKSSGKPKAYTLEPFAKALPGWRVAGAGAACAEAIPAYVAKVKGARFTENGGPDSIAENLEGIYAEEKSLPAFHGDASVAGLPIVEVPAEGAAKGAVIFYSGDGGWAGFDQDLAASLAAKGNRVLGLSTLKYFWSPKIPASAAEDLAKLLRYAGLAKGIPLRLVGYSFGADVLPELVARLPADLRGRITSLSLLGLGDRATFEFHFTDWIGGSGEGLEIEPVLKRLSGEVKIRCLYGEDESDSLCAKLDAKKVGVFKLPGGHHFDGDSEGLAKIILDP